MRPYVATAYALNDVLPPKIDGSLEDLLWKKVSPVTGFVWKDFPDRLATYETVVYVAYDQHNLYIGFKCYDSQPSAIVNRISRRGQVYVSDVIAVYIDPHHDHRTGYKFACTPGGVQSDSYRYDDSKVDSTWEGIWWVKTAINNEGWTAELKIPFSNFRFSDAKKQVWGINFERFIKRKRETDAWKPLGGEGGYWTRMSSLGHLVGLEDIKSGKQVETYPYIMGGTKKNGQALINKKAEIGVDFQYRFTNQFRFSSTFNPDFAQVEADQLEINLTRFRTRFRERRPFFIEGSSVFATPLELFYSRRIGNKGDILWGANTTGKIGNYTLGLIAAQTGNWDYFGLRGENEDKEDALFTTIRFKRDIFEQSNIGVLYSGKEFTTGEGSRVVGLDSNIKLGQYSIFTGQAAQSFNNRNQHPTRAYLFTLARLTDRSNVDFSMERIDPEFSIDQTGFLRKEQYRGWQYFQTKYEYTPRPEKFGLKQLFIGTESRLSQGLYTDQYFSAWQSKNPNHQITPQFTPDLLLWSNSFWFRISFQKTLLDWIGTTFRYARESDLTDVFWSKHAGVEIRTDTAKKITTNLEMGIGDFYNFSQKYVGTQRRISLRSTLRPKNNLTFELTNAIVLTQNPNGKRDGRFLFNSLQMTYLFTRDVFFRVFGQALWNQVYYDQAETNIRYLISCLVGWEYSPKSHFFFAYNEDWETLGGSLHLDDRVFVIKVSYLWNK